MNDATMRHVEAVSQTPSAGLVRAFRDHVPGLGVDNLVHQDGVGVHEESIAHPRAGRNGTSG